MKRVKYTDKRNKAFIGAAISAVGSLASGIFGGISAKKQAQAQEELYRKEAEAERNNLQEQLRIQQETNNKQQEIADKNATIQNNLALNEFANNLTVEDYNKKLEYKCGGVRKRKKAKWGAEDTNAAISVGGSIAGSLINGIMSGKSQSRLNNAQFNYAHVNDDLKNDLLKAQSFIPEQRDTLTIAPTVRTVEKEEYNNVPVNNRYNYNQMELARLGIYKRRKR